MAELPPTKSMGKGVAEGMDSLNMNLKLKLKQVNLGEGQV
jgi:hypothetical protein